MRNLNPHPCNPQQWEATQKLMKGSVTILLIAAMHLSLVSVGFMISDF